MEQNKTKEAILFHEYDYARNFSTNVKVVTYDAALTAMQIYADQQVALNERKDERLITEDILLTVGFEPVGESSFFKKYKLPNGIYIHQAVKVIKKDPFGTIAGNFYMGENHTHIPTVHFLQNFIYFNYNGYVISDLQNQLKKGI